MPLWVIKYLPHFVLVLGIVGAFFFIRHQWTEYRKDLIQQGYNQAIYEVKAAQERSNQLIRDEKRIVKHEAQSLGRADIIIELCSRGELRTPEYCAK